MALPSIRAFRLKLSSGPPDRELCSSNGGGAAYVRNMF